MDLLKTQGVPRTAVEETVRSSGVPDLVFALAFAVPLVLGGRALVEQAGAMPWWSWIGVGPFALVVGLLLVLLVTTCLGAFGASLRATNWLAKRGPRGVFLNLRSYRNAHFEGEHPTVVYLPFDEIRSFGTVVETSRERLDGEERERRARWLELDLSFDTASLADLLERERELEAPERSVLGVRSSVKHRHWPVRVVAPGRVWIERPQRLARLFRDRVQRVPDRATERGREHQSGREYLRHAS